MPPSRPSPAPAQFLTITALTHFSASGLACQDIRDHPPTKRTGSRMRMDSQAVG